MNYSILVSLKYKQLRGELTGSLWTARNKCRCMVLGRCMTQWGQPAIYCSHVQKKIPFLQDQDERVYVVASDSFISEHVDEQRRPPAILWYHLLDAPYESMSFLIRSRIWRVPVTFKIEYCAGLTNHIFLEGVTV